MVEATIQPEGQHREPRPREKPAPPRAGRSDLGRFQHHIKKDGSINSLVGTVTGPLWINICNYIYILTPRPWLGSRTYATDAR